LKAQLQALEAKLEEARRKKSTLVARQRAAEARSHMTKTLANFEAGFDAQANFTRMEDKVAEIEARTDAMAELNADASSLEKEFWDMQVEQDVEDDLEMLRRKLRG
jgi:phage shock protein A